MVGTEKSRYDSRVTLGNLLTIAFIVFSAGSVIASLEMRGRTGAAADNRIEAKIDVMIEQQAQLRERVAVLEDRSRRTR